jgi:hypothetical protein
MYNAMYNAYQYTLRDKTNYYVALDWCRSNISNLPFTDRNKIKMFTYSTPPSKVNGGVDIVFNFNEHAGLEFLMFRMMDL